MENAMSGSATERREVATLAGGCFWCLEAAFTQLRGVDGVVSGYTGGHVPNPSYFAVCTGVTGHAEAVHITFDPGVITFRELLEVFFTIHDPTTPNKQGPDVGSQYRSAVYYHTPEQRAIAEEVMADLAAQKIFSEPLVTQLEPLDAFYPAEPHHQKYFERNPEQPYCQAIVAPKVAKVRREFLNKLKRAG